MIRAFEKHDIDSVMKLWLDTNISAHSFIKSDYWQNNFDIVKRIIPDATVFIYEQNGTVQGFIGIMDGYIAGIFICEEMQSKGIGKQLLDYAKNKYDELFLNVYKKNHRALRFYERENFSITAERIDENTGEVEYTMHWRK